MYVLRDITGDLDEITKYTTTSLSMNIYEEGIAPVTMKMNVETTVISINYRSQIQQHARLSI